MRKEQRVMMERPGPLAALTSSAGRIDGFSSRQLIRSVLEYAAKSLLVQPQAGWFGMASGEIGYAHLPPIVPQVPRQAVPSVIRQWVYEVPNSQYVPLTVMMWPSWAFRMLPCWSRRGIALSIVTAAAAVGSSESSASASTSRISRHKAAAAASTDGSGGGRSWAGIGYVHVP